MEGQCRFCGVYGELQDSHILPRWAAKRVTQIRMPTRSVRPLDVEIGRAPRPATRVSEYLLCLGCERTFGKWDGHVADVAVQPNGSFPALERARAPTAPDRDGIREGDGSALGAATGHFAASVVWRASVSSVLPKVTLGPYERQFEAFLRRDVDVLEDARLILQVVAPRGGTDAARLKVDQLASYPTSFRENRHRAHQFAVPGLVFTFAVGKSLPPQYDQFCFIRTRTVWLIDGAQMARWASHMIPPS